MKTLTSIILSLALVMFSFVAVYSMDMDKKMDKSDDMTTSKSMSQGDMKMKSDGMMKDDAMQMKKDEMHMKSDDMKMKSDGMHKEMKSDDMMKDDSMHMDKKEMMDDGMEMKKDKMMDQSSIPTDDELRQRLTPLQYKVTRKNGTEPPFKNAYWDNHEPGIYVDIISGKPLFSSTDKYDSGTGWPSFTRPLDPGQIVEKEDRSFFSVRTEIRSKDADAHLGHVFADGPAPTGLRYCMNSAALRFVPKADLEKEGYAEYVTLFN